MSLLVTPKLSELVPRYRRLYGDAWSPPIDTTLLLEVLAGIVDDTVEKCDGNHGGPRSADPECWNDDERLAAIALANRLLDEPNCDPDDDLRVLSRQLLRRYEEIERLRARETELLAQIESMRTGLDDALDKVRRRL